jgi:pyruvate dehydrogenase E1 component
MSTTMAFVNIPSDLMRNKDMGHLVVPIVPHEARTFGMEALFRQPGIYSPVGQLYEPVDRCITVSRKTVSFSARTPLSSAGIR